MTTPPTNNERQGSTIMASNHAKSRAQRQLYGIRLRFYSRRPNHRLRTGLRHHPTFAFMFNTRSNTTSSTLMPMKHDHPIRDTRVITTHIRPRSQTTTRLFRPQYARLARQRHSRRPTTTKAPPQRGRLTRLPNGPHKTTMMTHRRSFLATAVVHAFLPTTRPGLSCRPME